MPTGYTSKLYEGEDQTFPEFALACARAFGALILMRDDPPDAEIPDEFTPSTYHVDRLAEAEARLAEVKGWDDARAEREHRAAAQAFAQRDADERAKADARTARYEAMLAQVEEWSPPTTEHVGMKDFMRDQLTESIRFDSYSGPYGSVPPTPEAYRADEIARAERDIRYHTKEHAKEVQRAAERSAWVAALRGSLTPVASR